MSIDMYLSLAKKQGSGIHIKGKSQQTGYEKLLSALQNFAKDQVLTSEAYDNAKAFCSDVLIPLAQGGILLSEAGAEASKQFPEEYVAQVDSINLKSSELEKQIQELADSIQQLSQQMAEIKSTAAPTVQKMFLLGCAGACRSAYENAKKELEIKLQTLISFHASSPTIFVEIAQIKQALEQGIAQANQSWDVTTQSFRRPAGASVEWAETISSLYKQKVAPHKIKDKEIFNPSTLGSANYFGGSQMNARDLEIKQGEFLEMLRNKFPEKSDAELKQLLADLTSEGCGYVAIANTFFMNYRGTEAEFEETFGFPMYVILPDGTKVVNHDALILDFYASTVYCQQDFSKEGALFYDESVLKDGTNQLTRRYRIDKYFGEKGFSITTNEIGSISAETYKKYAAEGKSVILTIRPVQMRRVSDDYIMNIPIEEGGHAMTVTGVAENGNLLVSSWGWEWEVPIENKEYNSKKGYAFMEVINY